MKEYKLNKTVLVVEVPENAKGFEVKSTTEGKPSQLYYNVQWMVGIYVTNQRIEILPSGNWQILSLSKEMTEEKLEQSGILKPRLNGIYFDYVRNRYNSTFKTRIESFHSFMQSIGVPCVNPYGDEPTDFDPDISSQYYSSQMLWHAEWQEAEAKLVNTLILVKEG